MVAIIDWPRQAREALVIPANSSDRRKTIRRKVFLGGQILTGVTQPVPFVIADCLIKDISKDGARLTLRSDAPVPESMSLDIAAKHCILKAHLIWRSGDMAGVCFDGFDSGSKQSIPFEAMAASEQWHN
jgi:hypothetical protein